jgi:hypothetical protein
MPQLSNNLGKHRELDRLIFYGSSPNPATANDPAGHEDGASDSERP